MAKSQRGREREWDRKGNPNAKNWGKATTKKSKAAEAAKAAQAEAAAKPKSAPKAKPEKASKRTEPKSKASSPRPKAKPESLATKDAMKGYRKGDVTSKSLETSRGSESPKKPSDAPAGSSLSTLGRGYKPSKGRVSERPVSKATPLPNPKYGLAGGKEGFQGKYGGEVGRVRPSSSGGRVGFTNPTKALKGGGGKGRFDLDKAKDPFMLF